MAQKIAVVAANGRVGKLVVQEAVDRGIDVTAVVRGQNKSAAQHAISKDALELTTDDLAGFDAVVDAVGGWTPDKLHLVPDVSAHLADILAGTDVRLVIVGGAGSLFMDPQHTSTLAQTPDFPDAFKGVASAAQKSLDDLRKRDNVRWTYISPAADFQADGKRTGSYLLGGEEFAVNERGESAISYADYAIALVDEVQKGDHVQQRISVNGR